MDGRRCTHDEAKVNVEQAAVGTEHEVVMVAVSNAQNVRHHAVTSAALHKDVQHLCFQPIWPCKQQNNTSTSIL